LESKNIGTKYVTFLYEIRMGWIKGVDIEAKVNYQRHQLKVLGAHQEWIKIRGITQLC